jgi:DNA processing protein
LIRQGAKLTETAHDILSELNFSAFFAGLSRAGSSLGAAVPRELPMDKEHKILLDALGFDPADLDVLVVRTGFKPEAVSSMMLILELDHVQDARGPLLSESLEPEVKITFSIYSSICSRIT